MFVRAVRSRAVDVPLPGREGRAEGSTEGGRCSAIHPLALVLLSLVSASAQATDFSWNKDIGEFTDATDWNQSGQVDTDGIPDANDTATFRRGNVPFVTVLIWDGGLPTPDPTNRTVNRVIVGTNPLNFGGHTASTLTVSGGNITETARGLIIGQTGTDVAVLNMNIASLSTLYATLGSDAGSSGTLNLNSATTGTFSATGTGAVYDLIVGRAGAGAINLSNGRDATVAGDTALGLYANSTGSISVAGAGSTWSSSGILYVGTSGAGSLSLSGGGQLSNTDGYIGANLGSTGSATVSGPGSVWTNSGPLYVGNAGDGTLHITSGGKVTSAQGYIGTYAESTAAVLVSGSSGGFGPRWDMSGNLYVGNLGDGTLTISDAVVLNATGYIGNAAGSIGRVSVDFGTWNNSAGLYVGHQGTGTLEVSPTGSVNTAGTAYIGYAAGSSGAVLIDDGRWLNNSVTVGYQGNGTLDVHDGGFIRSNHSNTNVTIGSQPGSDGAVHLTGVNAFGDHAMWRLLSGSFYVGNQGTGSLDIADGGQLINEAGYGSSDVFDIGSAAGSDGVVMVRGAGSILSGFGQLTVGRAGPGSLDISGGAVVDTGSGYIGHDSGITGMVTIDGTGSFWETPGQFHVGYAGDGTMRITNGGRVRNYGERASVGQSINSTGAVTVDGDGSKWSLEIGLEVGYAGTGTLDITGGGVVESEATTIIGGSAFGVGVVNVNGIGSHFEVIGPGIYPGQLYIGRRGSGALNIIEGALATILVAHIGGSESTSDIGDGTVTVDGAGSRLEVPVELFVGHRGEGTLTVTNGAYLQAGDTVIGDNSGAIGTLIIDGSGSQALFEGGPFKIGNQGDGTLEILNGAQVTTTSQVRIGAAEGLPGGNGEVIVDGSGSSLSNGDLRVGVVGRGTLDIRNGGQVTSRFGIIGSTSSQTTGIVTVDGPGSSWTMSNSSLTLQGNVGAAVLHITGGGSVSNTTGFIGNGAGTNGKASVDGSGSRWVNSGNLSVGGMGNGMLSVTHGATVQTPNLVIGVNGELQGDGNIVANVQNAGVVSSGSLTGALNVAGNYTQTATGELVIGLASATSYDQLLVTGNISLAGALRVPIEGFFAISVDDEFDLLDFASLSGVFSTIDLPALPGTLQWDTTRLYTHGILVISTSLRGDIDLDGDVDRMDAALFSGHFGKTSGSLWTTGDFDGDGGTTLADWGVLQSHLGITIPSPSATAPVPEPSAFSLLAFSLVAMMFTFLRTRLRYFFFTSTPEGSRT